MIFNRNFFISLPRDLKKSDYVDFLLFLSGSKPCIRVGKNNNMVYDSLKKWCYNCGYKYIQSKHNFMYISKYKLIAMITMFVDDLIIPHAYILGKLLGYPGCCSRKISDIGENNIDNYEQELIHSGMFQGENRLISPEGYLKGVSLISHVPCSYNCKKSLKIAQKTYKIIFENKDIPEFAEFVKEWIK